MATETITGWDSVSVNELNPNFETIPAGDYTFRVVGAAPSKFNPSELQLAVAIDSEGEVRGRQTYIKLKNPAENPGVLRDIARLRDVTGIDAQAGETALPYLSRLAAEGARFGAPLTHYAYKDKETGEDKVSVQVQLRRSRPAA